MSAARLQAELASRQAAADSLEMERPALANDFRVAEKTAARSDVSEAELTALGAELGDALAECRLAELRIEHLADALTELKLVTEAVEDRARQSADSSAAAIAQTAIATAELELARDEAIELRHLFEQQAAEWKADNSALAAERDRLADERREIGTQRDRLAAALVELAARIDANEQHAEHLKDVVAARSAEVADVAAQRARLIVERAEAERRAARLSDQCSRADRQIVLLEKQQEAADERARQWQVERAALFNARDSLTNTQEQLRIERDQAAAERDQAAAERDQAAGERDSLTRMQERLRAERDQIAGERDSLATMQEHLRVERDEFARSMVCLADALSDLGGRLIAVGQQAERADTAAAAAAERGAQFERHAAWADRQIAQFVEQEAGLKTIAARLTGQEISASTDVLDLFEAVYRQHRELEREIDRECAERERLSARLAAWEGSSCAAVAAWWCSTWRGMIAACQRIPQRMGKIIGR